MTRFFKVLSLKHAIFTGMYLIFINDLEMDEDGKDYSGLSHWVKTFL